MLPTCWSMLSTTTAAMVAGYRRRSITDQEGIQYMTNLTQPQIDSYITKEKGSTHYNQFTHKLIHTT